ncbi:hypothetical protein WUBG_12761 [Wuchereria bancrofti]|uniref:Uncharacterized protein n=1 Tax=Wuchereria bancrofti TaxID=6293 RepID=J9APR5_WUCBA|nr:hypothetical protein WUBG_12761 [Wuchereria bancrofti]
MFFEKHLTDATSNRGSWGVGSREMSSLQSLHVCIYGISRWWSSLQNARFVLHPHLLDDSYFAHLDHTGRRTDIQHRPEQYLGSYELVV